MTENNPYWCRFQMLLDATKKNKIPREIPLERGLQLINEAIIKQLFITITIDI